jgi:hypothetical protein
MTESGQDDWINLRHYTKSACDWVDICNHRLVIWRW